MLGEGIMDTKFVYNNDFILHLFINDKTMDAPNIIAQC